jgi:hypothetical protein
MRYANKHFGEKGFKFERLKDLADMAERGDYAVSYDLMSGNYHVSLFQASRTYVGLKWGGKYYVYNCLPFGLSTAFSKVLRELVMQFSVSSQVNCACSCSEGRRQSARETPRRWIRQ